MTLLKPKRNKIPTLPYIVHRGSHAEICPVCHGSGKVRKERKTWAYKEEYVTCHGCGGKGWVTVYE